MVERNWQSLRLLAYPDRSFDDRDQYTLVEIPSQYRSLFPKKSDIGTQESVKNYGLYIWVPTLPYNKSRLNPVLSKAIGAKRTKGHWRS